MLSPIHVPAGRALEQLQNKFLSILPRLKQHFRVYFRHVACQEKRSDLVSEAIALSWRWFLRIAEQGKDATHWPTALASFAAKAVRSGRRVCGQLPAKDAMSERAQQRHGFCVGKLPDYETLTTNPLAEALAETPDRDPSEMAAFRVDFPSWVKTYSRRDRKLIGDMMIGHRTLDLARKYKLSSSRISQRRFELKTDWETYTADPAEVA
ncbi:MAG: hypothetical protein JNM56_32560 [Planctomycetia bacterium]|nr:hypothetical protein [Planctomycetia bacterium]